MKKAALLFCLALTVVTQLGAADGVLLSEFMAANTRTLADENGDFEDWIEIFNAGGTTVDLAGWSLTDNPGKTAKWSFPATNLAPGRFLVVFASDKNRRVPGAQLHANFKLEANGEYLALVQPGGVIATAFAPAYPPQAPDISYGLPVTALPLPLLAAGAAGRFLVPPDGALGMTWIFPAFDDAAWSNVTTGVGFDTNGAFVPTNLVSMDVGALMCGSNASVYLRLPFVVTNAAAVDHLALKMHYNDGFVAYLNGVEVARRHAPCYAAGGTVADSWLDWSNTGQQGANGWYYGFWNRSLDTDGVYSPYTDFNNTDAQWQWSVNAWQLGPGDPPWDWIGVRDWHPNGEGSAGGVHWVIRRWVSDVEGVVDCLVALAKGNPNCGNGVTLHVLHNGAGKFSRTIASDDTTGFSTNLVLRDVRVGDFVEFALDPLGTDGLLYDWCDGSTFSATLTQTPSAALTWNSAATLARSPAETGVVEEFDLTAYRGWLLTGTNTLALHGLNAAADDANFLLLPELSATHYAYNPSQRAYFTAPTPGAVNGVGTTNLGPIISSVAHAPTVPADGEDLAVTAKITPTLRPVGTVTLKYRVMFDAEAATPMFDDGAHGDGAAGDGVFGAVIPASVAGPGQMARYYVLASDTASNAMRAPPFADPLRDPQYYGTVVRDPTAVSSLPVLHWFVADPGAADNDTGTRCAVFFDGQFSDNVMVNLHGQSTRGFPKRSYDFYLAAGINFVWPGLASAVDRFDLLTTWADKTHMRSVLAHETYRDAGSPAHYAFAVRVQQNGQFYSVANVVEKGGERFLDRVGLDPDGALYKMYNTASDTTGAEKKTRQHESTADLQALIDGMGQSDTDAREAFMYDNLDLPEFVNFFAAKMITADIDCCHKNYYLYRDSNGTREWQMFPWDVDLSFGRVWTCGDPCLNYFDETIYTNQSIWVGYGNTVATPLYDTPATRQMFLRRLRTLMDALLQPPGTSAGSDFYYQKALRLRDQIAPDAALDLAKWGSWGSVDHTITEAVARVWNEFLPGRRAFMFGAMSVTNGAEIPVPQPTNVVVEVSAVEYRPNSGDQREEWISLSNPNSFAVDISGWRLDGGARFTFKAGTVLPPHTFLYVSPDVRAFRARAVSPKGGEKRLVVGPYSGNLSSWGETLTLTDTTGHLVTTSTYPGTPSPAQQFLRVTELMYNPSPLPGNASDAQEFEFIELKNLGPAPLDLTGVRFTNGIEFNFTGSAATNLASGAYVLVVKNAAAFTARYGAGLPVAGEYTGSLDNGGETLRLEDAFGEKILEFAYDNNWYPITDGLGFSLVIRDATATWTMWGDQASWRPSGVEDGSPNADDPAPLALAPILVNEALTHTDLPEVDAIELFNPTASAVDISGWFLTDDFLTPKKFHIPAGTVLTNGGFVVFTENDFNPGGLGFALGSDGDEVWLFSGNTNGHLTGYFQGYSFGAAQTGVSFGRYTNSQSEVDFVAQSANTLGTPNAPPRVGPVVISEIMFHPPDLGTNDNMRDEFIELQNITANAVALFDPANATHTWRLRNAVDFDFPTNLTLPPDGRLLVVGFAPTDAAALAAFRATYGLDTNVPVVGPWSGKLDNSAETIELKMPDTPNGTDVPYVLVEKLAYRDSAPWPLTTDGWGASLQRLALTAYANDPTNWSAAPPSPGAANVQNLPPVVRVDGPLAGTVFHAPANLTLSAAATDSDGVVTNVEFFADGAFVGRVASPPFAVLWANAPAGVHSLQAVAFDDHLGVTVSAIVTVTVLSQPPRVAITSPANGAMFLAGSTAAINIVASDPDGSVASVQLFAAATKLVEFAVPPYTFAWSNALVGLHALNAVAIDNTGRSATSAIVNLAFTSGYTTNVTLVATGALWKYFDKGQDLGTNWVTPSYNDSGWSNGLAELGYGDADDGRREATIVSYGPDSANKYPTTYFRRAFTVMNAGDYTALEGRLLRDDGAVVWLNGVELWHSNMATNGLIGFTNYALSTISASEEVTFFTNALSPALLVEGTNLVAVEIHQGSASSSDISFDLALVGTRSFYAPVIFKPPVSQSVEPGCAATFSVTANGSSPLIYQWRWNGAALPGATQLALTISAAQVTNSGEYSVVVSNMAGAVTSAVAVLRVEGPLYTTQSRPLIPLHQVWKYNQSGVDLGTAWKEPGFDDSAWPTGAALLGFENSAPFPYFEPMTTPLTSPAAGGPLTVYFRTHFNFTGTGTALGLISSNYVDDGAVFYLNGAEVARLRLPPEPVSFSTLATNVSPEGVPDVIVMPAASLLLGDNVLAAEVHQSSAGSSDVVFGMTLDATVGVANHSSLLDAQVLTNGGFRLEMVGVIGGRYAVDASSNLLDWTEVTVFTNLADRTFFLDPAASNAPTRFYRSRLVPSP